MYGVVAGLCEKWKWEQSGVVYEWMVLSVVGCVQSGSGSSQAWRPSACIVGCVKSESGSSQVWCMCACCVVGGLCDEWKCEQSVEVYACMVLSLGCVKSGSGSSRAWCMSAWCCRWAA